MDPLADKILVISALVCFVSLGLINPWWVLIIIVREFLVTSLRLVAADEGVVIAANKWGKVKTVSQIIAIALILAMQYAQELIAAGTLSAFSVGGVPAGMVFLWIGEALMAVTVFFTVLWRNLFKTELEGNRQFEIRKQKAADALVAFRGLLRFSGLLFLLLSRTLKSQESDVFAELFFLLHPQIRRAEAYSFLPYGTNKVHPPNQAGSQAIYRIVLRFPFSLCHPERCGFARMKKLYGWIR